MQKQRTFFKSEFIALLFDFQSFLDVQSVGIDKQLFPGVYPQLGVCVLDTGCEHEWVARILSEASPFLSTFRVLGDFLNVSMRMGRIACR